MITKWGISCMHQRFPIFQVPATVWNPLRVTATSTTACTQRWSNPVAIIKSFQVWPDWNPFQASYACHRFLNYCNINTFEPVTKNEIWTSKSPNMVYFFTTLIFFQPYEVPFGINPARVSEWCIQHLETLSSIRWIRTGQPAGNCELWAVTTKRRRQVSNTKRHVSSEWDLTTRQD